LGSAVSRDEELLFWGAFWNAHNMMSQKSGRGKLLISVLIVLRKAQRFVKEAKG
jgi:hypothetical protein